MMFLTVLFALLQVENSATGMTYQQKLDILSYYEPGSDECYSDKKVKLEVLFLIDRSSNLVLGELERLGTLAEELAKEYENAKLGVAMYSDFDCRKWKTDEECTHYSEDKMPHHQDPEGCYTFGTQLSENLESLKTLLKGNRIKFLPSGDDESGFAALVMAAADTRIGWSRASYLTDRHDRAKIIFLISDAKSNCCRKSKNTVPPKGDGTDRCKDMENPGMPIVGEIMRENDIAPFLLLTKNVATDWENKFKDEKVTFGIAELTHKINTGKILEKFREFVLDIRLSRGPVGCADPPGYNTLGF